MLVLDWVKNGFSRQKVNVKISSNVVWWVFFVLNASKYVRGVTPHKSLGNTVLGGQLYCAPALVLYSTV